MLIHYSEAVFFTEHKKMKNKKNGRNKKGSVLLLIIIITGAMLLLGFTCLHIVSTQYQIRKSNSEIKRAFYLSEGGLNRAFAGVYELICETAADSVDKAEEFLLYYPDDPEGAETVFYNSYKLNISSDVYQRVNLNSNPFVKVTSCSGLFMGGKLTVTISSEYVSDSGIVKTTSADIVILVPDYHKTRTGEIDFTSLLYFNKFDL